MFSMKSMMDNTRTAKEMTITLCAVNGEFKRCKYSVIISQQFVTYMHTHVFGHALQLF